MFVVILLLVIVLAGALAFLAWRKRQRREMLLSSALTPREWNIVLEEVPLIRVLPDRYRHALEGKIALFIDQVEFIGCDGLEVTEEMEFAIAAQASLLLVGRDLWYDHLTTVMIYPGAFKSVQQRQDGYVVTQEETVRLGESWSRGPVILSWNDSRLGARNTEDGHNVVIHEFAHQMDDLSGETNGVPILGPGQRFEAWRAAIVEGFQAHVAQTERGRKTVLDAYGATSPEEFFAVAVETFFEKPQAMRTELPEVYSQLGALFQLQPHLWGTEG